MTIVITKPDFLVAEALRIMELLGRADVDLVHIRKPGSTVDELERLLQELPSAVYGRLVLHDHFELAVKYGLHGVHLNSRNPEPPQGWHGSVSRSCHSIQELAGCRGEGLDYMSLSPVFDSISKQGYRSAFSRDEILAAHRDGIIDSRVLALGGVTFSRIPEVLEMGFGGAMILGDAWK